MSDADELAVLPAYPDGYARRTQRLHLSPVSDSDSADLWPLVSDPRLCTFLAWEPHRSPAETAAMVTALTAAQLAGQGFHWTLRHAGALVGLVSLIDVRRRHRSWTLDRAELAYWIGVPHQGRGFATEAAAAVVDFGFLNLHLHKIRVYHAADNPASARTIAKIGFRYVGEERDAFRKAGQWHHLRHFELLAGEWPAASDRVHTELASSSHGVS